MPMQKKKICLHHKTCDKCGLSYCDKWTSERARDFCSYRECSNCGTKGCSNCIYMQSCTVLSLLVMGEPDYVENAVYVCQEECSVKDYVDNNHTNIFEDAFLFYFNNKSLN